jgi:hypothetical protein
MKETLTNHEKFYTLMKDIQNLNSFDFPEVYYVHVAWPTNRVFVRLKRDTNIEPEKRTALIKRYRDIMKKYNLNLCITILPFYQDCLR